MFQLGDFIDYKDKKRSKGVRLITYKEKDFYKVVFVEGEFNGKSYWCKLGNDFIKQGNIFEKRSDQNERKKLD